MSVCRPIRDFSAHIGPFDLEAVTGASGEHVRETCAACGMVLVDTMPWQLALT